jgi:predicted peptidase
MALITAMRSKCAAVRDRFEARLYTGSDGRKMPYRLFQPARHSGKLPLILWLHGAGGLGDDNRKQIAGGNLFGSHVWALPEHQERVPCYVVAPQTSFGWIRYDAPRTPGGPRPKPVEGFGDGARMALEIVDALRKEFAIDERRLYVMGNSMGGGGTWHMLAHKPGLFAAAIPVAGGATSDPVQRVAGTPLWNFHGDADKTVDVSISRKRIDALRKAGGSPLYTEYPGVGHNANEWAFTEPALIEWLFHQKRRT